jgi:hypothetical protein
MLRPTTPAKHRNTRQYLQGDSPLADAFSVMGDLLNNLRQCFIF